MGKKLNKTIRPLMECEVSLKEQRKALREMFALAISNIPENETDNFTAKRLTPVFLSLSEMLDNMPKSKVG